MAKIKWLLFVSVACLVDLSSAVGIPGWRAGEDESGRVENNKLVRMSLMRQQKSQVQPITFDDWIFYTEVSIGTPPQKFRVILDTGFDMFWIASTKCKILDYNLIHPLYNSSKSSTYIKDDYQGLVYMLPINIPGVVYYNTSIDTVTIGNISIKNQIFGEVTETTYQYVAYVEFDGILGLGFNQKILSGKLAVPFQRMIEQKLVDEPIYSVYIKPNNVHKSGPTGGEIIFGGIDHQYYEGEITYVPVMLNTDWKWSFQMDRVSVTDGLSLCENGCEAFVDTANTFINGPLREIKLLNEHLGAYRVGLTFKWMFPSCDNIDELPNVSFMIGGRNFELRPQQYVYKYTIASNVTYCVSGFRASETAIFYGWSDIWSLGTIFVETHYTIFDFGQAKIGFTDSKQD